MNTDLQGRFPDHEHIHKFFMFETKSAFEPIINLGVGNPQLYERNEYAILACNCSEVKKIRIVEELKPKDSIDE